jgi:hypothetical protein
MFTDEGDTSVVSAFWMHDPAHAARMRMKITNLVFMGWYNLKFKRQFKIKVVKGRQLSKNFWIYQIFLSRI